MVVMVWRLGFERDGVAEGYEVLDVVAFGALGAEPGVVEVGAKVLELRVGVKQQLPDDDQDGSADRDQRPFLATTPGDPALALTKEGVGAGGGDGGFAEYAGQVAVAARTCSGQGERR